jgi:hypothetical protein
MEGCVQGSTDEADTEQPGLHFFQTLLDRVLTLLLHPRVCSNSRRSCPLAFILPPWWHCLCALVENVHVLSAALRLLAMLASSSGNVHQNLLVELLNSSSV